MTAMTAMNQNGMWMPAAPGPTWPRNVRLIPSDPKWGEARKAAVYAPIA